MASVFCTTTDIRDELLSGVVVEADCLDADQEIYSFASSLGVEASGIANPTPYKVKALAIAFTCVIAARGKSLMNTQGEDGEDAYELKRKVWQTEVNRLMNEITADTLLGGSPQSPVTFPLVMGVFRA